MRTLPLTPSLCGPGTGVLGGCPQWHSLTGTNCPPGAAVNRTMSLRGSSSRVHGALWGRTLPFPAAFFRPYFPGPLPQAMGTHRLSQMGKGGTGLPTLLAWGHHEIADQAVLSFIPVDRSLQTAHLSLACTWVTAPLPSPPSQLML